MRGAWGAAGLTVLTLCAGLTVLLAPAKVDGWGAAHVGVTRVGPGGGKRCEVANVNFSNVGNQRVRFPDCGLQREVSGCRPRGVNDEEKRLTRGAQRHSHMILLYAG